MENDGFVDAISRLSHSLLAWAIFALLKQARLSKENTQGETIMRIEICECMPMMADVISGNVPRPVNLPDGLFVTSHVATPDGDVYWPDVAPAWKKLGLPSSTEVCRVARRNRVPELYFSEEIALVVTELRLALGENGAAICACGGRLVVFNSDGTRAAYSTMAGSVECMGGTTPA